MIKINNKSFSYTIGKCNVNIDISRFESSFCEAQEHLDRSVLYDTEPYVRWYNGYLNDQALENNEAGSGNVIYYAVSRKGKPYAYETYTNTTNKVTRTGHPEARPLWFEYSKQLNKEKWVADVKKIAGGNNNAE